MRLPRMTTGRWMIAVAVVALLFGGYREARRLKRKRESCLARATWHAEAEAFYRRSVASAATLAAGNGLANQAQASPPETSDELDRGIERWFGFP